MMKYLAVAKNGKAMLNFGCISGYYAGYIASAFTLGRFVSGYAWGYLTDSVGRKPVIISGLLSIMICSLAFGLSPTFGFAIAARLVLGLTNGLSSALKTTLREACGPEHVFQGMAYLSGGKTVSLVFGTGIGGLLAQPAVNFPSVFSASGVFGRIPFLLPNLVGSVAALVLLPLVIVYVPETKGCEERRAGSSLSRGAGTDKKFPEETADTEATGGLSDVTRTGYLAFQKMMDRTTSNREELPQKGLPRKDQTQKTMTSPDLELQQTESSRNTSLPDLGPLVTDSGTTSKSVNTTFGGSYDDGGSPVVRDKEELGLWGPGGVFAAPHVKLVLFLACVVQTLLVGFEGVYPLWALSTPDRGGLGWATIDIGQVFLAAGVIMAVVHLGVLPGLTKVLGITILQRMGCVLAIAAFTLVPYATDLSWNDNSLYVYSVISAFLVYISMAVVNLALTIASASMAPPGMRGKVGGLYSMVENLGRSLGPTVSAIVFAWSISTSSPAWVDYQFVFLTAAFAMVLVTFVAWDTITDEITAPKEPSHDGVDVVRSDDYGRGTEDVKVRSPGFVPSRFGKHKDFL